MQVRKRVLYSVVSVLIVAGCNAQGKQRRSAAVTFSKQVLTKDFVSEGVAIGDV